MNILFQINKILKLSFDDSKLEKKYQSSYLQEHLSQNILAAKIAIIIYLIYAPLTYSLIQSEEMLLVKVVLFSISMPVLFIFISKSEFFYKNQYLILYLSAVVAGVGPVLFYIFTENERAIFQVDVLIPLIAIFTMYGVGFSLALVSVLTILIIFFVLAVVVSLPLLDVFMAVYTMIVGGVVTTIAGYLIEKSKRKLFLSKQESDEFKYILDNANDFIAIHDIETHKYLYANNAVLDTNNLTLDEIVQKTITDVHPELDENSIKYILNRLNKEGKFSEVLRFTKPNNEEYYVHTSLQYGFFKSKKVIITLSSEVTQLKQAELKIKEMAELDPLTKLYNRYKLDEFMSLQINIFHRYKQTFSLVICDIDYFKQINDTYGHLVGDEILKNIASLIQENVRESDVVARWGGEEFAILLPNTTMDEALHFTEKIHQIIRTTEHQKVGHVYISCGLSEFREGDTQLSLFHRVDNALYEAKNRGRDQISTK